MRGEPRRGRKRLARPLVLLAPMALGLGAIAGIWISSRQRAAAVPEPRDVNALDRLPSPTTPSSPGRPALPSQRDREVGPPTGRDQDSDLGEARAAIDVKRLATAELVSRLRSTGDPWLKTDLIEEIAARHPIEGGDAIAALLRDQDRAVRRVAADALGELGDISTLPALKHALPVEPDDRVRATLIQAIDELRER